MDTRLLRYAVAIAETGSFTRAAARLGISQPPLSAQIARLEREVGARLFDRGRRRSEPTAAGRVFCDEARAVLARLDGIGGRVRATAEARPRLAVGYVSELADARLPRLLARFRHRANVELHDLPERELLSSLLDGQLDLAFLAARPPRSRALKLAIYRRDPLGLITARDVSWTARSRLADHRCLVLSPAVSLEGHERATRLYRRAGVPPDRIASATSVTALVDSVAAGLAVAILPRGAVRSREVSFHRVAGLPSVNLVVAHRNSELATELVAAL